ncbi:MAG: LysR family transcriptional regulator [Pseudomonadota bacterium]
MNFTLDQLRAFHAVAETGGVGRAADRLHLTQPAVTSRIKALEAALGSALFDRQAGMRLTSRGHALFALAEQYLMLSARVQRDVMSADGMDGMFRIGVSETIVQSWLPDFIRTLRETYPKLVIEIDVDISRQLRDRLFSNAIDLALMMGPVSDDRVENVALPPFEIAWFRAPDHRHLRPDAGAPVITFSRDTRPHRQLKEALAERYGPGSTLFPSSSLSACFRMVGIGLGVGALPKALAKPYEDAGEVEQFTLGWCTEPLQFTASFLAGPEATLRRNAADVARITAIAHNKNL